MIELSKWRGLETVNGIGYWWLGGILNSFELDFLLFSSFSYES